MKKYPLLLAVLALALSTLSAQELKKEFVSPSIQHRPSPLWFWNDTEVTREGIDQQMVALRDQCGYGGLAILPFGKGFKPKYLSEEYFSLYEHAVKRAKELGMVLSLYDEYGFPSGSAGAINGDDTSRFALRYPEQTLKRLDKIEHPAKGKTPFRTKLPETGRLMSACALHPETGEVVNLTPHIKNGEVNFTPQKAGDWKILLFLCVKDECPLVDYLSPEAVKDFVEMTHEAYYQRMNSYFGSTITTSFFDEPTLYRAEGRVWTPDFNEKFARRFGFHPNDLYPALWYNIGPRTQAARNYLHTLRAELYNDGFTKVIDDWNRAHGIMATGHQDNEEMENPVGTSGDFMYCFKNLEIPGIDKIGGNRPAEKFYKLVSSAAYNWDKTLAMSETYGAMGNLPVEEMYAIAMDQYAKGINVLIPHAAWYDTAKVVFKPELSNRSPIYGPHLKEFNTYLSRLNLLLRNDHAYHTNVGILYPIHTLQGEHYFDGPLGFYKGGVEIPSDYIEVSRILTEELGADHLFLHPEVLTERCCMEGDRLKFDSPRHPMQLDLLVVPQCETLSPQNMKQIKAFYDGGGKVIFTSRLPKRSTEFGSDRDIKQAIGEMLPDCKEGENTIRRANGKGTACFVPHPTRHTLAEAFDKLGVAPEVIVPRGSGLRYIHKTNNGRNLYFIANPSAKPFEGSVYVPTGKPVELWNPHTGQITPVTASTLIKDHRTLQEIHLRLPAVSSMFVIERE